MAILSLCSIACAMRAEAAAISVSVCGSGISRLMVGSRKASASSASTPRPASTRASNSGMPWRCAMVSARACRARRAGRARRGRSSARRRGTAAAPAARCQLWPARLCSTATTRLIPPGYSMSGTNYHAIRPPAHECGVIQGWSPADAGRSRIRSRSRNR